MHHLADTPLCLHDTLSGTLRPFQTRGSDVTLYVCGVTPYDTAHLGHGFTYVSFDVLLRYLRYLGYRVRYIQNVTDLDDPLFDRAQQLGISYRDLAAEQIERHLTDMKALNVIPADAYPRASLEITDMIEIVECLLRNGHAYVVERHVYFSVATHPGYGKLSKCDRKTMLSLARERGGDPDDVRRKDPLDFVLWRPSRAHEPAYVSPWGDGLPGWHLECSAMSLKYLGAPIDIHGGGSDLIFPHHENEIAQSEDVTAIEPFARYWLHTGMVHLGGEKMSKSLGNMVFVRDLIREYGGDAVRLAISGTHYRSELHYYPTLMERSAMQAQHLMEATSSVHVGSTTAIDSNPYRQRFLDAMNNDLHTPEAVRVLDDLAGTILAAQQGQTDVAGAQATLRELSTILGLTLTDSPL